jgi:membrane protein YdbS with pleckstrin-like domain
MRDDVQLHLRPVFVGWITFISLLPLQLFFTFWSAIFFGIALQWLGLFRNSGWLAFGLPGGLSFVLLPMVLYLGKKLNYSRTEYRFVGNRLEIVEGFFSISQKTIGLQEIKEVTLHKGVLQRMCDLGSIYLATAATGSFPSASPFGAFGLGNVTASGVTLRDLQNPDDAFQKIRAIMPNS